MKAQMSKGETKLRNRFDFSKGERGKFHDRFQQGYKVTLLDGTPDSDDPLASTEGDSQLVEIAGKHLLISRLIAAGYEVAEPLRDKGIDLIVYRDGKDFLACPVQMKASTHESFSLDRKYERISNLLIAYVWNVSSSEQSDVYVLTFSDALKVLEKKGYAATDSWTKRGYYFVRNAGSDLKELLRPHRMSAEQLHQKIRAIG